MSGNVLRVLVLTLAATVCGGAPAEAQWGSLKGQFVYDGPAPAAAKLVINKDQEVCGKHGLVDETLLVSKTGGVANVVVWLRTMTGQTVKVHPDLEAGIAKVVKCDNSKCRFEPHILAVWNTKQKVQLLNSDTVGHNVNCTALKNESFNILLPPGANIEAGFPLAETLPLAVQCNIHPWMKGWIVVRDHPYVAVTDAEGNFEIKNLPAGTWTFQFWHERSGYVMSEKTSKLGRADLEIKAGGALDLGKVLLKPEIFNK